VIILFNKFSEIDKNYLIKDIEELSELIKEIAKFFNKQGNIENLIEEFADSMTAIEHIRKLFNINDKEIENIHKRKGVYKKYEK
jgi:predicted house-cleaning noncanonical NTP pyrophosphatase (MazG superfamily)